MRDHPLTFFVSSPIVFSPEQRMTTAEANELLVDQIAEIQSLTDELDANNVKVDETKKELGRLVKVVRLSSSASLCASEAILTLLLFLG